LSNQPESPQPDRLPDPAAPPPPAPDGTSAPGVPPAYPPPPAYSPGQAGVPSPDHPATSQFPPVSAGPPVNYAPPGYTPDYGHGYPPPGYPPQGYPPPGYGQPVPPPPRKSNVPIVAVILAVTLLLCGGVVTAGVLVARNVTNKAKEVVSGLPTTAPTLPGLPTEVPDLPGLPSGLPGVPGGGGRTVSVTYEVTGDGPARILYLEKLGDPPVTVENAKLPWRFTAKTQTPALLSVIAVRTDSGSGSIACRELVDGQAVKSTSNQGGFATATCTYLALD
jgi:hypothetical protein